MTNTMIENPLRTALLRFETCIQTPIVPGELTTWLSDVQTACNGVEARMQCESSQSHQEAIDAISSQDLDQVDRVQQLRESEQHLMDTLDVLTLKVAQLCDRAPRVEPDESKLAKAVDELIEKSLAFVQDSRKQDIAITTWFSEAMNRDTGAGD